MDPHRRIEPLATTTIESLRSSFIITSFSSVALELVQNSIDAGATKVTVHADVASWEAKCVDDGRGVSAKEIVKLGERYGEFVCHFFCRG